MQFVEANFGEEGQELELWTPEDWNAQPRFIRELKSGQLRGLAKRINRLLRDLSRKIKDDVRDNSHLYSIIYVPNGFVVPGGEIDSSYHVRSSLIVFFCFLAHDLVLTDVDFQDVFASSTTGTHTGSSALSFALT